MKLAATLLLALPVLAHAQIYRCTGPDGRVSIQQAPCPSSQKQQEMEVRTSTPVQAPPPATATQATGSAEQRIARNMERERRIRDLEREIQAVEANMFNRNAVMSQEMAALRNQKRYANNNLAGATWEQSISTEMQAVAAKYQAMNDADRERVKQLRANVEVLRQQGAQSAP